MIRIFFPPLILCIIWDVCSGEYQGFKIGDSGEHRKKIGVWEIHHLFGDFNYVGCELAFLNGWPGDFKWAGAVGMRWHCWIMRGDTWRLVFFFFLTKSDDKTFRVIGEKLITVWSDWKSGDHFKKEVKTKRPSRYLTL